MIDFPALLRFFTLSDAGKLFPVNQALPTDRHASLPILPGDRIRVLLPASDLAGHPPNRVQVFIAKRGARPGDPLTGHRLAGLVRQQKPELYSEVVLRVNSAPLSDDYRQFALTVDLPNPGHKTRLLSLGAAVTASSTEPGGDWSPGHLTDGTVSAQPGNSGWSSTSNQSIPHKEWVVINLDAASTLETVVILPRPNAPGWGFPIDFLIETSTDGITFVTALTVLNYPQPVDGMARSFALPAGTTATHLRITGTRLRNDTPGDPAYRMQLGEVSIYGTPVSEPKVRPTALLNTFRGQQTDLDAYVSAIRAHFEGYPYTPVEVSQNGNELTIRAYHSQGFQLGNIPVRIGIGQVIDYNTNNPSVSVQPGGTSLSPAKDAYTVSCGEDIEAGNRFTLGPASYQATGNERPADVLRALGVTNGQLTVAAGMPVGGTAEPGTFTYDNQNQPKITLLYDSTSGSVDRYTVTVGNDILPGNVYQLSSSSATTRLYTTKAGDTRASVEAFFNNAGGRAEFTSGATVTASANAGNQTQANTNRPSLALSDKQILGAASIDQYVVYINSSIRPGNTFTLGMRTVVATPGDTVLTIAQKLGYNTHPIRLELPAGTLVKAYAGRGPRYSDADIADIDVLSGSIHRRGLPLVCQIDVPVNLEAGEYTLTLADSMSGVTLAQSNGLVCRPGRGDTRVLRYGDQGVVFGMEYAERALCQQVRVTLDLGPRLLKTSESLGLTIDDRTIRGLTTATTSRKLTTRPGPASFHRALWAALCHRRLLIDHAAYRAEGAYQQEPLPGRHRDQSQAQIELIEAESNLTNTAGYRDVATTEESTGYAAIGAIRGGEGLDFFVQGGTFTNQITLPIRPGQVIPAGTYRLLVRINDEAARLAVYVGGLLALNSELAPDKLNRIDAQLMATPGSVITIAVTPGPISTVTGYVAEITGQSFTSEFDAQFQ